MIFIEIGFKIDERVKGNFLKAQYEITTICNEEVDKVDCTPTKESEANMAVTHMKRERKWQNIYTIENGTTTTAAHFSKTLRRKVNESTVRSIKKHVIAGPSKSKEQRLPHSPRGRPLKLGVSDELVKTCLKITCGGKGDKLTNCDGWSKHVVLRNYFSINYVINYNLRCQKSAN